MHKDRTQAVFDSLGVFSRGDAQDISSYRTAARFGKLALCDFPCQICELAGVLGQVKTHSGTRGGGVADNILRACAVAREASDGYCFDVSRDAWIDDLSAMHKDCTQAVFDSIGVFSRGDAQDMLKLVVGVARHCFSYRIAARFGKLALLDFPCQVCELAGVLGQVKTHLGTRGGGVADNIALGWLLKRLPGQVAHMTALSRSFKVERCRARGAGNGLDMQCAGNVGKSWLNRGLPALQKSMWHLFLLGRSDPFQPPTLHCAVCVGQLGDAATSGRRKTCDACRRAHRQSWDRQRQHLNRQ
jgi:hypothetical protein